MIANPNWYRIWCDEDHVTRRLESVLLPDLVLSRATSSSHLASNLTVTHLKKMSAVCYGDTTAAREIERREFRTCVDDGEQPFA